MMIHINKGKALKILLDSYVAESQVDDHVAKLIYYVLNETHKTYKYILVNGLLAKSTEPLCNPLALQAGAPIEGAFDARSLCHSVLVIFERKRLSNVLGGSNEPFLNKPARFTHLSVDNAVRKGRDKKVLNALIEIFTSLQKEGDAFIYLSYSMFVLKDKVKELEKLNSLQIEVDVTLKQTFDFIFLLLQKSHEGETCVIVVAALERLLYKAITDSIKVIPHKVNQSGASSKEIGDIDIYNNKNHLYSIEVKDKDFNESDIQHAVSKAVGYGSNKFLFIYGLNANYDKAELARSISDNAKNNVILSVQSISKYVSNMLIRISIENPVLFVNEIMNIAVEINCKEDTKLWIHEISDKIFNND